MSEAMGMHRTVKGTDPWLGFRSGLWTKEINVHDFIQTNVTPYYGDDKFLSCATQRTQAI